MGIIQKRIDNNTTGSKWLIRNKRKLRKEVSKYESNVILTEHIYKNQRLNIPVSEWEAIDVHQNDISKKYDKVYKIMSTALFVVHENDLLQLAYKIMDWKNIHHIPVVDKNNLVVGVLEKQQLENLDFTAKNVQNKVAKHIMTKNYNTVKPETSYEKVKALIETTENSAVIVLKDDKLVGIFTKNDLERIEKIKNS